MDTTGLLTDKYELTMLQAALQSGDAHKKANFELFARDLPKGRRYGVIAGTQRAIDAVENFKFSEDQLEFLRNDPEFTDEFVEYLRDYEFKGKIYGLMDGDLYFPHTPILNVMGTFADSVILETVLLSILNHDSAVASAASRMVVAAEGTPLIEMGSRRTHEEAAVASARAAYIVGFDATSNLEAGHRYDIPVSGTAAHAFTLNYETEEDAFRAQVESLGKDTTLLVDTYDIEEGIRTAVKVAGTELGAIRIDSGDLHDEPNNARRLLDELGAVNTRIVVSSDIDEYSLMELSERGTPIDGAGVGTRLVTGSGHPTAGMVFKLVERENSNGEMVPVAKKSSSKASVGGVKWSIRDFENGFLKGERIMIDDKRPNGALQVLLYADGAPEQKETARLSKRCHREIMSKLPVEGKLINAGSAFIVPTFEEA